MSQSVSWADLTEDPPASVDPPHASGNEPDFSGFLNPPPSPAGPPLAFASGAGPQETENSVQNQVGSAKCDVKVYTPYTSNNMFDGMAVEAAPPALAFGGCAVASATATSPASAGGSAPPTAELSLLNPNAPEFRPGLVSSLHDGRTPLASLRGGEGRGAIFSEFGK